MNKAQKAAIEDTMSLALHKIERLERKIEKADGEGDETRANKYRALLEKTAAEMNGMRQMLNVLGYYTDYVADTDSYRIAKFAE